MPGINCTDLRAEYLTTPLGIGTRFPRLTWRLDTEAPGIRQVGFAIELSRDGSPLWSASAGADPGAQAVVYDGPPLDSHTRYTWRVRASVDGYDEPGEWASSRFETGYLRGDPWLGKWVQPRQKATYPESWTLIDWIRGAGPDTSVEERLRPAQLVRQEFHPREPVARARLYATARGVYEIAINGAAADDQVLGPGSDSYRSNLSVQCFDVTPLLSAGRNVVSLTLADGWWAGRVGITGSSAQWGDRTSATWQLLLEYTDGTAEWVGSDSSARSAESAIRYSDIFVGECLDARLEMDDWQVPAFDATSWTPVEILDNDFDALTPFVGEPVRRIAELRPISITGANDAVIVDFGQVIAGRIRLSVFAAERGRAITIEHSEALAPDGSWFANIVGINKEQRDVFVPRGDLDGETFEPRFTFHGFRYVRLSNLERMPQATEITAIVLGSDLETAGSFVTSDARINRLHENVVWSQRGNFLSIPTDCPQRERVGWGGDIQAFAPASTNNMMVAPFLGRWLNNLRADQLADGGIPIFSPRTPRDEVLADEADGIGGIVVAAGWSDAITVVPWTLYERYGDARVLRENYAAMRAWVAYQRREAESKLPPRLDGESISPEQLERNRLLYNSGLHFGDWLTPSTMAGKPIHESIVIAPQLTGELMAAMFQAQSLTLLGRVARVLDDDATALECDSSARAVRAAFAAEYLDANGALPVELQGVYVVALAFDMVPSELRPQLGARLASLIEANGRRLDTGFLSVPHLLDAVWDTGRRDLARALLWQSELPSWLYEVDHGATSIWESWDTVDTDGSVRAMSQNHYAPGSVDDWMFRRIAGITPASPGYRAIAIAPDFECGLANVAATRVTPYGTIAVEWHHAGEEVSLSITVPPNCEASVELPNGTVAVDSGAHSWQFELTSR